jgi:3-dehydrotetronate 4-kinase
MLLGCVADDFTGASDLANTLAKEGMAVTQFMGLPTAAALAACEAGVVALKTRTIPVADAVKQSLDAADWLLAQGCQQILFKYCSTFDSTREGNIGPVAEALLDRLGAGIAVVCPVFPATGRTLFNGHLFVGGRLLSETGMKDHPLTPMTDPDIRRWLQHQCQSDVGLVPYADVRKGPNAITSAFAAAMTAGQRLVVTDAVTDDDLRAIGAAAKDHKLITGGSGIALGLPANFRATGLLANTGRSFRGQNGPGVALSGSCSVQSLRQVAKHGQSHPVLMVTAEDVIAGRVTPEKACTWAVQRLDQLPMIASSADAATVRAAQDTHGREVAAAAIEQFMGQLAIALVAQGVTRLVVGGGETSGAVVQALGIKACTIGPEIDPGVPALSVEGQRLAIALKSGNFGADDFYAKAFNVLGGSKTASLS